MSFPAALLQPYGYKRAAEKDKKHTTNSSTRESHGDRSLQNRRTVRKDKKHNTITTVAAKENHFMVTEVNKGSLMVCI